MLPQHVAASEDMYGVEEAESVPEYDAEPEGTAEETQYTDEDAAPGELQYTDEDAAPGELQYTEEDAPSEDSFYEEENVDEELLYEYPDDGAEAVEEAVYDAPEGSGINGYTLSLDPNYGGEEVSLISDCKYYKLPRFPQDTRTGLVHAGWSTEQNAAVGEGDYYNADATVYLKGDLTLYAVWQEKRESYTVTIDINGGECAFDLYENPVTVKAGELHEVMQLYTGYLVNYGYSPVGFSYSKNGKVDVVSGDYITVSSDIILYTVWRKKPVTRIYNMYPVDRGYVEFGNETWRVIGETTDKWLLFAPYMMGSGAMNYNDATAYCETIYNSFSQLEKAAVVDGKVFLLSDDETKYYLNDTLDRQPYGWWLRGPDENTMARIVNENGDVELDETMWNGPYGCRPVFVVDRTKFSCISAATGPKSSSASGSGDFGRVAASCTEVHKLTMIDDSRSGFAAQLDGGSQQMVTENDSLTVHYEGAPAGDNEYVSAVLTTPSGFPLYHASLTAGEDGEGTWEMSLPSGLGSGVFLLKVFSEQQNGDHTQDLASPVSVFKLGIGPLPYPKATKPYVEFYGTGVDSGVLARLKPGMKYSLDGGKTWVPVTAVAESTIATKTGTLTVPDAVEISSGITVENGIQVVNCGKPFQTSDSDATIITVEKLETPDISHKDPTWYPGQGFIYCPTDNSIEYSLDGTTWKIGWGTVAFDGGDGETTVYVRARAAGDYCKLSSDIQVIVIRDFERTQQEMPNAVFTATGPDSGILSNIGGRTHNISIDGGVTWASVWNKEEYIIYQGLSVEKGIQVYVTGNASYTIPSEKQYITLTKAEAPAQVKAVDCSVPENDNGKLTGVTSAMEYMKDDNTGVWTTAPDGEITGLTDGQYLVRTKGAGTALASDPVEFTIGQCNLMIFNGNIEDIPVTYHAGYVYMHGMKWRILGMDDGRMLLIANDRMEKEPEEAVIYYDTLYGMLSTAEQNALVPITKTDQDFSYWSKQGTRYEYKSSTLENARMFYLSAAEAGMYFESNNDRLPGEWLLRRSMTEPCYAYVKYDGDLGLYDTASIGGLILLGIRPACVLDRSSVLFESAVAKSSAAAGSGEFGEFLAGAYDDGKKLTILDSSRSSFTAGLEGSGSSVRIAPGSKVLITYENAQTGDNEYVSAMICDADGEVIAYASLAADETGAGEWDMTIPEGLDDGFYTLKVFNEQQNGTAQNILTDYASGMSEIELIVTAADWTKLETPAATFTATGPDCGVLDHVESGMKYSIDGGENWSSVSAESVTIESGVTAENGIQVYRFGNRITTLDSDIQEVAVTKASLPEGVAGTDCIKATNLDGTISGITAFMEYRKEGDSDWTTGDGSTLTGLSDGNYYVRRKASGAMLASEELKVTIAKCSEEARLGTIGDLDPVNGGYVYLNGIKWHIIGESDDQYLLISADLLGEKGEWEDAPLRCEEIYDQFTTIEQGMVVPVSKEDGEYCYHFLTTYQYQVYYLAAPLDKAKVFLPSPTEALWYMKTVDERKPGNWFLRNATASGSIGMISGGNEEGYPGFSIADRRCKIRPMLVINKSGILYTSAPAKLPADVATGSFGSFLTGSDDDGVKLTVHDSVRDAFTAKTGGSNTVKAAAGARVAIDYENAGTGENDHVSAMLYDSEGELIGFASIKADESGNGIWDMLLPADLSDGTYTLKVFSEQQNGDAEHVLTDYAGAASEITLTVASAEFTKEETPEADFAASGTDCGTLSAVTSGMKYSIDGGTTWIDITTDSVVIESGVSTQNGILIYKCGDRVSTLDSDVQEITITKAKAPEDLSKTDCTNTSNNNGTITGVTTNMEYRSADSEWIRCTGNTITGLSDGTYQVRVCASGTVLTSDATEIEIKKFIHVHEYTMTVTKESTCTETGIRTYTCACGDSYTEEIPLKEHEYVTSVITKKPTCRECGIRTETCKCGHERTVEIPRQPHDRSVQEITKEPTVTERGELKYHCKRCGDAGTEWIEKLNPDLLLYEKGKNEKPCAVKTLVVGGKLTLTPKYAAGRVSNERLVWTSSNPDVATVTQDGAVVAKCVGLTLITARSEEDTDLTGVCYVSVTELAGSIVLDKKNYSFGTGETVQLTATVLPATADQTVEWTVNNANVSLNVSEDTLKATVTAGAAGKAVVTAKTADGSGKSATCSFTVGEPVGEYTITGKGNVTALAVGKTLAMNVNWSGKKPQNPAMTWASEYPEYASVSDKGVVTGLSEGQTRIRAYSVADSNGVAGRYIMVYVPVKSVQLNTTKGMVSKAAGANGLQLSVKVTSTVPGVRATGVTLGTEPTVTWSVDPKYAENLQVTENGLVTAGNKPGNNIPVTATVTAYNGYSKTLTCKVTVKDENPLKGIKIASKKLSVGEGNKAVLSASLDPLNPDGNAEMSWSSSDPSVVSVDEHGVVTALAPGSAVITVTAQGTITSKGVSTHPSASCTVTVTPAVSKVEFIDAEKLERQGLGVGKSFTLKTKLSYSGNGKVATNGLTWKSSDPTIATVSDKGIVKAIKSGEVTITAASSDMKAGNTPAPSASVTLNVYTAVTGIQIDKTKLTIGTRQGALYGKISVVKVLPAKATDPSIVWTVSGDNVALAAIPANIHPAAGEYAGAGESVTTRKGEALALMGLHAGRVKLTGTAADGSGKTVTSTVTILGKVTEISLKTVAAKNGYGDVTAREEGKYESNLKAGSSLKLTPLLKIDGIGDEPATKKEYAEYKKYTDVSVSYRSSNQAVASVDKNGKITTKKEAVNQSATIYVISADGKLTAELRIFVK